MIGLDGDISAEILDALDGGVLLLDADRRVVAWSTWLEAASGVAAGDAAGRTLEDLFPGTLPRRLSGAVAEALETGASSLLTHSLHPALLPLRTRTGKELIHTISVRPVGQKPYRRCLVQITDVTAAANRERLLRERQNARYDALVDSAPDAILTLDGDGVIQFANPAATRELGYGAQELIGQRIALLLPDQAAWDAVWNAVRAGEATRRPVEVQARRKDGSRSYLEVSASRWLSEQRVFVTAILRDVNERHAVEQTLRNLNQILERRVAERTADRDRMWRLSTDVMLVARLDGTVNAVNPAWTQLLGWQEYELVGADIARFVPAEDQAALFDALRTLSRSTTPHRFALRLFSRGGEARWIEWSAATADGLLHAVGRDVTAERQAEQALREAEEALRQAQKMEAIGQLTGGIAHDFNNLLTGIIGSMEVLKRRIAAGRYEDTDRFMEAAVASANRAAALTHRLLAFARRQPLDPRPLDANELVRGMEDLLRRTLGEQARLSTHLAPDLWPTLTDPHQLENALLNLAINGRDAMPEGGSLTIATANLAVSPAGPGRRDGIEPGEYVAIAVSDTGHGMTRDVIEKAFEPFFTTKPIGQGTGLGLSMIYGFVRQSRGHVQIESTPGQGTTVRLLLPRHQGRVAAEDGGGDGSIPGGTGETVLLVEDDPSVRLLIAEVLRDLGYGCVEAGDSLSAMAFLESNARLDLMITDVGLPGLNGRQLAEMARQHRPALKVLFVTGYAAQATGAVPFLEPGMDMVTKPFALDALALKIREIITA